MENKNLKVTAEMIEECQKTALSIISNELKQYYLLGDTNEFDNFDPNSIDESNTDDLFSLYKLACCSYVGYKTKEDEQRAFSIWRKCSKLGEVNSMLEYSAYLFSLNEKEQAFKYLANAGKKGNKIAILRIAICYIYGIGTVVEAQKGVSLLELLAKENNADALYYMSLFLDAGLNGLIAQDRERAKQYLEKSVELNSYLAKGELGFKKAFLLNDKSLQQEGLKLLDEAAEAGDIRAMTFMAIIYANGEMGFNKDLEKSKLYLALAYDAKFPLALRIVEELKSQE